MSIELTRQQEDFCEKMASPTLPAEYLKEFTRNVIGLQHESRMQEVLDAGRLMMYLEADEVAGAMMLALMEVNRDSGRDVYLFARDFTAFC